MMDSHLYSCSAIRGRTSIWGYVNAPNDRTKSARCRSVSDSPNAPPITNANDDTPPDCHVLIFSASWGLVRFLPRSSSAITVAPVGIWAVIRSHSRSFRCCSGRGFFSITSHNVISHPQRFVYVVNRSYSGHCFHLPTAMMVIFMV